MYPITFDRFGYPSQLCIYWKCIKLCNMLRLREHLILSPKTTLIKLKAFTGLGTHHFQIQANVFRHFQFYCKEMLFLFLLRMQFCHFVLTELTVPYKLYTNTLPLTRNMGSGSPYNVKMNKISRFIFTSNCAVTFNLINLSYLRRFAFQQIKFGMWKG